MACHISLLDVAGLEKSSWAPSGPSRLPWFLEVNLATIPIPNFTKWDRPSPNFKACGEHHRLWDSFGSDLARTANCLHLRRSSTRARRGGRYRGFPLGFPLGFSSPSC